MKRQRPWNRVSEQVYSLSTLDERGNVNMNIATYVVPVTMDVKRYMIAVYKNTKTHINIFSRTRGAFFILQGLSEQQKHLVRVLGKKSGITYTKQAYLEKNNLLKRCSIDGNSFAYLNQNSFSLYMKIEKYIELGDHDLIVARVIKVLDNNFEEKLLTTEAL